MCNAGQSVPARADGHPDGAYTCFVNKGGRVIELDGGRGGAIDRGECTELLEVSCELLSLLFLPAWNGWLIGGLVGCGEAG